MPESTKINSRPSIHKDNNQTSETEELVPEQSEGYQHDSLSGSQPESDNDSEMPKIHSKSERPTNRRRSVPKTIHSPKQQSQQKNLPESESKSKVPNKGIIFGALLLIVVVFYPWNCMNNDPEKKECSFKKLQELYPEQNPKVWKFLTVGIEDILNKRVNTPAVYLFVHNGGEYVNQQIWHIASHSSSCFGNDMRPVKMENNDFNSDEMLIDYGYAIKKFKQKIQNGNVILIANLNEIPAKAARALHTICDTVSPIAPDIVIFLTLTVPDIDGGNVESITEDALTKMWGQELANNELYPLITRVTDQVIALKS